ncbi:MAG: hypothetical protein ABIJ21_09000 [Nanoarchaeota archaeon]
MKQLTLFPEPEITSWLYRQPPEELKKELDEIAQKASEHPLLLPPWHFSWGKWRNQKGDLVTETPESRLEAMRTYIHPQFPSELYTISLERLIGAAYFWDGWQAVEAEFVDPHIEIAFILPQYKKHGTYIKRLLAEELPKIKEDRL